MVQKRLADLAAALGDKDWLADGRFTAGDLLMATVLRILRHTELVARRGLAAYLARCEARPAFQRALAAQMAAFGEGSQTYGTEHPTKAIRLPGRQRSRLLETPARMSKT